MKTLSKMFAKMLTHLHIYWNTCGVGTFEKRGSNRAKQVLWCTIKLYATCSVEQGLGLAIVLL
jgi:hypothetical protein